MFNARRETDSCQGSAEYAFEESILLLKIAAERVGQQIVAAECIQARRVAFPVDEYQALRFAYRKRMQHYLIEQGLDGSSGTDAKCKRKHRGRGERRTAAKRSSREAQVVCEVA